jgi:uncharacterized protein
VPDVEIRVTPHGRGVFALRDFKRGELILEFKGKIYFTEQMPRGFYSKSNHFLQVDKNQYLGPSRTPDNYVNHSCNPNSAVLFEGGYFLRSIRPIRVGEEISFDYSTTMDEENRWTMRCACSHVKCRNTITDFKDLPSPLKRRYINKGMVAKFCLS